MIRFFAICIMVFYYSGIHGQLLTDSLSIWDKHDALHVYNKLVNLYYANNRSGSYSANETNFRNTLRWFDSIGYNNAANVGRTHLLRGINLRRMQSYEEAEGPLLEAIEFYARAYPPNDYKLFSAYINLGENYLSLGNYDKAIELLQISRDKQVQSEKSDKWSRLHINLAMACLGKGLEEEATHYMDIAVIYPESKNGWSIGQLLNFAGDLSQLTRYVESDYYLDSIIVFDDLSTYNQRRYYNIKSQNSIHKGRYDEAQKYLEQEKNLIIENQELFNNPNELLAWNINNHAVLEYYKNNYSEAIKLYQETLGINESKMDKAKIWLNISISFLDKGNLDSALNYIQKASNYLGNENINSRSWSYIYNSKKVELYLALYDRDKEIKWLALARKEFSSLENFTVELNDVFFSDHDIEDLASISKSNYHLGIKTYLRSYQITDIEAYIDTIEQFIQKSKSVKVLLHQVRRSYLHKSELNNFLTNGKRISYWKEQCRNSSQPENIEASDSLDYYLNLHMQSIDKNITYKELNFDNPIIPTNDQTILNYYFNSEDSLLIRIDNHPKYKSMEVVKLPLSFFTSLHELRRNYKFNEDDLDTISHYLLSNIDLSEKELRIIPDHILFLIPFDILKHNREYLIKNFDVAYAFHSQNVKNRKKNNWHSVSVYAPDFSHSNMVALPYNHLEKENLLQTFSTLKSSNNWEEADLVHFATHTYLHDYNSDLNTIFLSPDISDYGSNVKVKDLDYYHLNNKLVTLSACETGQGEIIDGEGVKSLSRGFFLAGAESVLHTLWQVNDKATSIIMDKFYTRLKSGEKKHSALRQAKLEYLEEIDPNYRNPYYWSGLVIYGDVSPVPQGVNFKYYLFLFGLISIIAWAIIRYMRSRIHS